jgi:hypothetical protein
MTPAKRSREEGDEGNDEGGNGSSKFCFDRGSEDSSAAHYLNQTRVSHPVMAMDTSQPGAVFEQASEEVRPAMSKEAEEVRQLMPKEQLKNLAVDKSDSLDHASTQTSTKEFRFPVKWAKRELPPKRIRLSTPFFRTKPPSHEYSEQNKSREAASIPESNEPNAFGSGLGVKPSHAMDIEVSRMPSQQEVIELDSSDDDEASKDSGKLANSKQVEVIGNVLACPYCPRVETFSVVDGVSIADIPFIHCRRRAVVLPLPRFGERNESSQGCGYQNNASTEESVRIVEPLWASVPKAFKRLTSYKKIRDHIGEEHTERIAELPPLWSMSSTKLQLPAKSSMLKPAPPDPRIENESMPTEVPVQAQVAEETKLGETLVQAKDGLDLGRCVDHAETSRATAGPMESTDNSQDVLVPRSRLYPSGERPIWSPAELRKKGLDLGHRVDHMKTSRATAEHYSPKELPICNLEETLDHQTKFHQNESSEVGAKDNAEATGHQDDDVSFEEKEEDDEIDEDEEDDNYEIDEDEENDDYDIHEDEEDDDYDIHEDEELEEDESRGGNVVVMDDSSHEEQESGVFEEDASFDGDAAADPNFDEHHRNRRLVVLCRLLFVAILVLFTYIPCAGFWPSRLVHLTFNNGALRLFNDLEQVMLKDNQTLQDVESYDMFRNIHTNVTGILEESDRAAGRLAAVRRNTDQLVRQIHRSNLDHMEKDVEALQIMVHQWDGVLLNFRQAVGGYVAWWYLVQHMESLPIPTTSLGHHSKSPTQTVPQLESQQQVIDGKIDELEAMTRMMKNQVTMATQTAQKQGSAYSLW